MGRKKHEEHENLERWLVSYADFITLMFAFFVVLWATGQADQEKLKKAMGAMNDAFGGGMSQAILDVLSLGTHESGLEASNLSQDTVAQPEIKNLMRNLTGSLSDHTVQIGLVDQELTLVLPEVLLFAPGSADLHPVAFRVLGEIAGALAGTRARVQVIGHADGLSLPPGSRFRDNWDLASARAAATARYLQTHGLGAEQLVASATTSTSVDPGTRAVRMVVTVAEWGEAHDVLDRVDGTEAGRKLRRDEPAPPAPGKDAAPATPPEPAAP